MSTHQLINTRRLASVIISAGALLVFAPNYSFATGEGDHGHGDQHNVAEVGGNAPHSHGQPSEHSDHGGAKGHHAMAGGQPGKAADVSRSITVTATEMEFNPKLIKVKAGETIRFTVVNKGELLHELSIGTPEMQRAHQVEMQKMMDDGMLEATRMVGGMEHGHGNTAMVEPGKTKEIIWKFAKDTSLEFGCNIPGHYESGMKGKFVIN